MSEDIPGWDEPPSPAETPSEEPTELYYKTLPEFVEDCLVHIMWSDVDMNARIWCPEWWKHSGPIVRLEALWRSWEVLRLDPAHGMTTWLREADYHLAVLHAPDGPFKGCSARNGHSDRQRAIPVTPPPRGLFAEGD